MGGWRWQRHNPFPFNRFLRKFVLSVGLPTTPHPAPTLQKPAPQVSLPRDLGHLKRVINSTSSVWRKGKQVLSGHNPIFPSLHPQNKLSPLQKGPLYRPWLQLHSGNWPRGQGWVLRLRLGKVGDLGVGKGKNPLK